MGASIVSLMNIVRVQFKVDGCMQNFNVWNKRQESLHTILHCAAIIPVREWKNVNGWISLILSPNPIYSPMFIGVQSFISSYRHTVFWSPPSLQKLCALDFQLKNHTFKWWPVSMHWETSCVNTLVVLSMISAIFRSTSLNYIGNNFLTESRW